MPDVLCRGGRGERLSGRLAPARIGGLARARRLACVVTGVPKKSGSKLLTSGPVCVGPAGAFHAVVGERSRFALFTGVVIARMSDSVDGEKGGSSW